MKRLFNVPPRAVADTLLRSVANHRDGTTLSEILISLMVMGIGVTSLALLISTSVLRSIQASQLTNAGILRLNAQQIVNLFPRLVHDPNNDNNLLEHETAGGADNPNNDGVNEGRFVVDPLGANDANLTAAVRGVFGNNAGTPPANQINRYTGGFNATSAKAAAYLPDTWQAFARGTPESPSTTSITAPASFDLTDAESANSATPRIPVRIVLFTNNGRSSFVRDNLTIDASARTVTWTDALPTGSVISRFRIEIFDTRYSWLLTVRKSPATHIANVDVVVFHKRSFSAATEQVFTVSAWRNSVTGLNQAPYDECTLDLSAAPAGTKPFLKKGSFLFDAQHAHWYRIIKVQEGTNPIVTIAPPVNVRTSSVMAMPGIVDVYPIDSVKLDSNNAP